MISKTPAFVLSVFDTGLYAARALRGYGVEVHGFDHNKDNLGFFSSSMKAHFVPNPALDAKAVLEILIHNAKKFTTKSVLIIASEVYLEFVKNNRSIIDDYFLLLAPSNKIIDSILNRSSQFIQAEKCGIQVPEYLVFERAAELKNINGRLKYPIIVKSDEQTAWKLSNLNKAYIADNFQELQLISEKLSNLEGRVIAQTVIEGECSGNFEYNAFYDGKGIISDHVVQKILQYPDGVGAAICLKTATNEEVCRMGRKYIQENGIIGLSNTEFKYDKNGGKYKFIEINARVWQQIGLTGCLGRDYSRLYYDHLSSGKQNGDVLLSNRSCIWVDSLSCLNVLFKSRSFQIKRQILSYLFTAHNYGQLSFKDPKLMLHLLRHMARI